MTPRKESEIVIQTADEVEDDLEIAEEAKEIEDAVDAVNEIQVITLLRLSHNAPLKIVEQKTEESQEQKPAIKRKQSIPILDQESKGVNKAFEGDDVSTSQQQPPLTTLQTEDKTQRKIR